MSLETAIAQNTAAVNALAEIVKQMMGMLPPTGGAPVTVAPVETSKAPAPEKAAPTPAPEPDPAPVPREAAPTLDELRASLKKSIRDLYTKNAALGKTILDKFGVKNISGLSDDQLPSFAKEVQTALQGI